jgi:cadmium resistance protein CadD (predicted permease)
MLAVLIGVAYLSITRCKCFADFLEEYSDFIIPLILIVIGILILKDSVLFHPEAA